VKAACTRCAFGKISRLDPHIDDLRPVLTRLRIERVANIAHRITAIGGQQAGKGAPAQFLTQNRAQDRGQLGVEPTFIARAADHFDRLNDAITRIGIDLQTLLIAGEDLFVVHIEVEHPALHHLHPVDKRDAVPKARAGLAKGIIGIVHIDDDTRFTCTDDHRLLDFRRHKQGRDQRNRRGDKPKDRDFVGFLHLWHLTALPQLRQGRGCAALPARGCKG